uniref:ANTH domain-containing protein n=1 Tax=Globodera pallida TaxID=36090 RepID=A0A183CDF9_GLOPA
MASPSPTTDYSMSPLVVNDSTMEALFASSTVWNSVSYASALPFADAQLTSPSSQRECHPMAFLPFSSPLTPTSVQTPVSAVDDTLLRLANFVNATNSDTQQQHQPFVRQQKADNSPNGGNWGIVYNNESNILTMSKLAMLELVRTQVRSPIVDFLCAVLADVNQFGHVCSFIASREFKIHNTKTFTELLNLRSRQKPKSYLQVARALKSYEDRLVDGYVMLRKVKDKRNQFKFFPDLP